MRRGAGGESGALLGWAAAPAWDQAVRTAASLVKYRIVAMVLLTMLSAAEVAARGEAHGRSLALVLLGGALAAAGAAALNHYFDRDIDACMWRTRDRPIPSGSLTPRGALAAGVLLVLAAAPPAFLGAPLSALWIGLAAFTYVVLYTCWLKRRSPAAVVVGGLTGSFAVLAGWSAVGAPLSPLGAGLAAVVFAWTPAHFWSFAVAYGEDYRRAAIPTLPRAAGPARALAAAGTYALATVSLGAAAVVLAGIPWLYAAPTVLAGAVWLRLLWQLRRQPDRVRALASFHASNLYLAVLFSLMALAAVGGRG